MMEKVSNPDVPVEVVLKYVVRERDHYKARVDIVANYAKALELRTAEMAQEMEKLRKENQSLASRLEGSGVLTEREKNKLRKIAGRVKMEADNLRTFIEEHL